LKLKEISIKQSKTFVKGLLLTVLTENLLEGAAIAVINADKTAGSHHLNCETDFVGKGTKFVTLAKELVNQIEL
jgi:hypothetical protein